MEFMNYFSGYMSDPTIFVYQINDCKKKKPQYQIIPLPEKLEYSEHNGIKYRTFTQTINDMLSVETLEDPQAIMESLNEYLAENDNNDPQIIAKNINKYKQYKKDSANYYKD